MRKYLVLFLLLCIFPLINVKAITYVDSADKVHDISEYKKYQFVIDDYDVVVNVTSDNLYKVTEKFTAYFFEHSNVYGVTRNLPLKNNIVTFDYTRKEQTLKIYDVYVNDKPFKTVKDNNKVSIVIGDPNKRVLGEQTYVISYTVDVGKDVQPYYDEFFFDVIPYTFDTAVGGATFTINFPKPIDTKYMRLSALDHNSATDNGGLHFEVNEDKTTIFGNYTGILGHNQGVNIRIELDDCYFETKNINFEKWNYWIYLVPAGLAVLAFIIWYLFGRDNTKLSGPQFYPPEGFNSLEIGFLLRTVATEKDILSLLLYLANMGYISIKETEEVLDDGKIEHGFTVIKEKDYDGKNDIEKKFLDGLFDKGQTSVASNAFSDRFYLTMEAIKDDINTNTTSIKEKSTWVKRLILVLFAVISFGVITYPPMAAYHELEHYVLTVLSTMVGFGAMFIMTFGEFNFAQNLQNEFRAQIMYRVAGILMGIVFGILPFMESLLPCLEDQPLFLYGYFFGLGCIFIICLFIGHMTERTTYGAETFNRIRGLKLFMELGKDEVIEKLLEENDNYCYDLLPYAYVLGVTSEWICKFEDKNVLKPFWYEYNKVFNVKKFGEYVERVMHIAELELKRRTRMLVHNREGKNIAN